MKSIFTLARETQRTLKKIPPANTGDKVKDVYINHDITQKKKACKSLLDCAEMYKLSKDFIYKNWGSIYNSDRDYQVMHLNSVYHHLIRAFILGVSDGDNDLVRLEEVAAEYDIPQQEYKATTKFLLINTDNMLKYVQTLASVDEIKDTIEEDHLPVVKHRIKQYMEFMRPQELIEDEQPTQSIFDIGEPK